MLHLAPDAPYFSELEVDRMLQAFADPAATSFGGPATSLSSSVSIPTSAVSSASAFTNNNNNNNNNAATSLASMPFPMQMPMPMSSSSASMQPDPIASSASVGGLPMYEPVTPLSGAAAPALSVESILRAQVGAMLHLQPPAPGPAILPTPHAPHDRLDRLDRHSSSVHSSPAASPVEGHRAAAPLFTGFPPISEPSAPLNFQPLHPMHPHMHEQGQGQQGQGQGQAQGQWATDAFTHYRERPSSSRASHRDSPVVPSSTLAHAADGPGGNATATLDPAADPAPARRGRARGVTFGVFEELQMRRALAAANGITLVNDTLPFPFMPRTANPNAASAAAAAAAAAAAVANAAGVGLDMGAAGLASSLGTTATTMTPPAPLQHSVSYGGGSTSSASTSTPNSATVLQPHAPLQHSLSMGADPLAGPVAFGPAFNDSACMLDPTLGGSGGPGALGDTSLCLSDGGSGWPSDMDFCDGGDDSAACSPCQTPSTSPTPSMQLVGHGGHPHSLHGHRQSPLGRAMRAPGSKPPRRYPRSHTCREPERAEFATEEEYSKAWATWRQIRDCNNEAVRKSRNSKKAILGCSNASCLHMLRELKTSEKTTELLVKAALTPYALTRAERKSYNRIIAARSPVVGHVTDLAGPASDAGMVSLRKQLSASDLTGM